MKRVREALLLCCFGILGWGIANGSEGAKSIMGGRAASSDEILATVALMDRADNGVFCTGTLVADAAVLTAAHCVVTQDEETDEVVEETDPSSIYVAAGVLDATSVPSEKAYSLLSIVLYPDFPGTEPAQDESGVARYNDLALLLLSRPVEGMSPVGILAADQLANLREGDLLTISGYGGRDLEGLQYGQLYVAETPFVRAGDSEFFAGGGESPDTCPGDSGGPAYLTVGDTTYLVGTTSRAADDAMQDCGEGGIYTLDVSYADWILQTISDETEAEIESGAGDGGCSLLRR